jgi:hypothetical protein
VIESSDTGAVAPVPAPDVVAPALSEAEAAIQRWIDRMDDLVSAETRALARGEKVDFDDFNSKKSHALLEFMAVSRGVGSASAPVATALLSLKEKLAQNSQALQHHLQAATEISKILISAIASEESDGTYSRHRPRPHK